MVKLGSTGPELSAEQSRELLDMNSGVLTKGYALLRHADTSRLDIADGTRLRDARI